MMAIKEAPISHVESPPICQAQPALPPCFVHLSPTYVSSDSKKLQGQVTFLQALKAKGPAGQCRICITCWKLIVGSEATPAHKDHMLTGSFQQMAPASKDSLKGLCTSKGKTRASDSELHILMFAMSDTFI